FRSADSVKQAQAAAARELKSCRPGGTHALRAPLAPRRAALERTPRALHLSIGRQWWKMRAPKSRLNRRGSPHPREAPMTTRRQLANAIRALSMDAVQRANSGHPGMPMGMADIAQALWCDFLRYNPGNPLWPERDRFVLSNGHGSMLLYSV